MADPRGRTRSGNTWSTRQLLDWTSGYFKRKGLDSPRLSAEMLLAHVLGVPRIRLYTNLDRPASPDERSAFRRLVERAAAHEPVQHIVGEAHFFSSTFKVTGDVLIPRPSTETLLEHVVQHVRLTPGFSMAPLIADVGTGSGCIAIGLAKSLPEARIVATDVSDRALAVAAENASSHGVAERIELRQGAGHEPLRGDRFQFVVSNPPYVSDAAWAELPANVARYEPAEALRGGVDGLDVIRPLIAEAPAHLENPGQLVLEISPEQKRSVVELATDAGLRHPRVLADHEGHDRMLVADA